MDDVDRVVDVVVVGAGFGGLSATLTLAERGLSVVCLEALPYAGGCASTFERHGVRYEAGATLFSGLAPATATSAGGFFTRALARHDLAVDVDWIDPVIEHRGAGGLVVDGVRDRAAFVAGMVVGLSAEKAAAVRRFLARQQRVADLLWPIFDDDTRLPAMTIAGVLSSLPFHLGRFGAYVSALPTVLSLRRKSVLDLLREDGVDDVAPLVSWCRSLCQIAVQTDIDDADALFSLCALDYVWRGTGHVRGGIGRLATAMQAAIVHAGGEVHLARKARQIVRDDGGGFVVETARGPLRCRRVLLNMLPGDAARLLGVSLPATMATVQRDVDDAWGAVMLYVVLRAPAHADAGAAHIDIVGDDDTDTVRPGSPASPRRSPLDDKEQSGGLFERVMFDGHHAFVSVAAADEARFDDDEAALLGGGDLRTATVSTHVSLATVRDTPIDERDDLVATIQSRLRAAVEAALPDWQVLRVMPASPRTFARYTGRSGGAVGGIARSVRRGWLRGAFADNELLAGAAIIGDSTFPGQSTLGVAVGGARAAHLMADRLGVRRRRR